MISKVLIFCFSCLTSYLCSRQKLLVEYCLTKCANSCIYWKLTTLDWITKILLALRWIKMCFHKALRRRKIKQNVMFRLLQKYSLLLIYNWSKLIINARCGWLAVLRMGITCRHLRFKTLNSDVNFKQIFHINFLFKKPQPNLLNKENYLKGIYVLESLFTLF